MPAPFLKVGQIIKGEALDYTTYGYGHLKVDNFSLFVLNLLPGEIAEVRVIKLYKTYGFGEVVNLIQSSVNRAIPFCPIYHICGGCDLQHLKLHEQTKFKLDLANFYLKQAGIDYEVSDILMMENSFAYRNKVSVPFDYQGPELKFGFYKKRSNEIVDFVDCGLQSDLANQIVFFTAKLVEKYRVKSIRHLIIREAKAYQKFMVTLVIKTTEQANLNLFRKDLIKKFPDILSLVINYNDRKDNVILGKKSKLLYGKSYLTDELSGLKFQISSSAFYQINTSQTKLLYQKAIEYAKLKTDETILDLYCGIGTIGLLASSFVKQVYGIEIVEAAVRDAKNNAELNNIKNAEFYLGSASDVSKFISDKIDTVFVDPPRRGLGEDTCQEIVAINPNKLIYVSCNLKSLMNDLNFFIKAGYYIDEFSLVDMFPETVHVETICLMSKK